MLLIETSRAYGRELVEGIAHYSECHGPWSFHFAERGFNDPLPKGLGQWKGDGVIARGEREADILMLKDLNLPVVNLAADPRFGMPCAFVNQAAVGELAVDHFRECALHNLAFFSWGWHWWVEERKKSFEENARQVANVCKALIMKRVPSEEKIALAESSRLIPWLLSLPKPCGVFSATDMSAFRVINACRTAGITVPEQVAVLGVDNDSVICQVCSPQLSSIDINATQTGYNAAHILDQLMAGEVPGESRRVGQPRGIVSRQSTDTLAIRDAEMAQVARFIRENACRGLNVQEVASSLNMSCRQIQRKFLQHVGRKVKQEILRVQMLRAKRLLTGTSLAIAEISRASGFASWKYFSKAFRREVGMSPREYRSLHQLPFREKT